MDRTGDIYDVIGSVSEILGDVRKGRLHLKIRRKPSAVLPKSPPLPVLLLTFSFGINISSITTFKVITIHG